MNQSNKVAQAKSYFNEALLKSDYYLDDQELSGFFRGKLAARLGLGVKANKADFFALADNLNPQTGRSLTARTKTERTIGYDINFHCPKSVSVLHALNGDSRILEAFQRSVNDTMLDIESNAATRVRKNGVYHDRKTGELVWGEFIHQTARPVKGHMPDPHLHLHAFVLNCTWDDIEQRFKAGKFREIKKNMPAYQAAFHKRLANELLLLGYKIKPTEKYFEIEGVPDNVVALFSKRTDEIGRVAKERRITNPKALAGLGARTRAKKQKGKSMKELRSDWRRQIRALDDIELRPLKEEFPIVAREITLNPV